MKRYLLYIIFIIAIALRFAELGNVPSGFHIDEAYLSYNGFSILKTGREIAGTLLPLNLKSFLYSPAGYSYFSIPFIFLFGLNEFSARFASAFFGSLTIPLTFLLVLKVFKNYFYKKELALASSFLLAISPWHINLSRVATENVLVVFFITLGVYLFTHWLEKNRWYLFFASFLSFLITLYIYQASRSFLPIFLPLLFIYGFCQKRYSRKKIILFIASYVLLIIIPVSLVLFSPQLSYRIRTLSIFQHQNTKLVLSEQQREDGIMNISPLESRFFHNKVTNYTEAFTQTYFKHFTFEFLFTSAGLPDRYRVPGSGLLYLFELPLIILGLWALFAFNKKIGWFIVGWILIAPIGSGLTTDDVPNLQRTLIIFPAISILSAMGLVNFIFLLKKKIKQKAVFKTSYLILSFIIFYSVLTYLHSYYIHGPAHRPWYRQEGYRELISKLNFYSKDFNKIVITDANYSPTIFLLFYNRYNPALIQEKIEKDKSTNYGSVSFDKYEITDEACPLREDAITKELIGTRGVLYTIQGTCRIPEKEVTVLSDIKRTDGTVAFKLVSIN